MDSKDAILLLAGTIVGGLVVYMLFFRTQTYTQPKVQVYRPFQRNETVYIPVQKNKETWEWTDWKGRPRKITVQREVKRLVQ